MYFVATESIGPVICNSHEVKRLKDKNQISALCWFMKFAIWVFSFLKTQSFFFLTGGNLHLVAQLGSQISFLRIAVFGGFFFLLWL